jgi:LmbE family N-acetylglucosaminyl deacetylase
MTELPVFAPFPEDWQRALAVVAHPDDLEYGTASAIARWTSQGKHVQYLLVTRGEAGIDTMYPAEVGPLREAEERRSAAVVGVHTVEFLGYPDGVVEYGLPLRRDIARAIRQCRPDIVLTTNYHLTWPGGAFNMADHRWVGLAVVDAARDAGNRWIFPDLLAEGVEPWKGVRLVCVDASPHATHAVDVTAFIERGIASLQAHQIYLQYIGGDFDPSTFLRHHAAEVGKRYGCQYAVSFEVINL